MKHTIFFPLLFASVFTLVACDNGQQAPEEIAVQSPGVDKGTRPNIIFIMSDDHAYQAIGTYGSVLNKTPNIDRIASGGMRFDRAYVSNSICSPAS